MDTPDLDRNPDGRPAPGFRWPIWVMLALSVGLTMIWAVTRKSQDPEPSQPPPPGWTRLTTPQDGFSVDMPSEPEKHGPVNTQTGGTDVSWLCVVHGYTYGVRRTEIGSGNGDSKPLADELLDGFCHGLKSTLEPENTTWRDVNVAGHRGREMRYQGPKAASVIRVVQLDRALYQFLVGAPSPDDPIDVPDVNLFLDSVRFARPK